MKTATPITSTEFEQRLQAGELRLTLVGMSNVGKTYWSQLLAKKGFNHFNCDDLIEEKLGNELIELGYSGGIADMAKWLGQPYDKQFPNNQQRYLQLEVETMEEIIEGLEKDTLKGSTVIDTTGSVVHTSSAIRDKLSAQTTVVYLEATPEMRHEMFELYIAEPKPVVWEDLFKKATGESDKEALARCYPQLLEYRSKHYSEMSDVTIQRDVSLKLPGPEAFLEYIKDLLPNK